MRLMTLPLNFFISWSVLLFCYFYLSKTEHCFCLLIFFHILLHYFIFKSFHYHVHFLFSWFMKISIRNQAFDIWMTKSYIFSLYFYYIFVYIFEAYYMSFDAALIKIIYLLLYGFKLVVFWGIVDTLSALFQPKNMILKMYITWINVCIIHYITIFSFYLLMPFNSPFNLNLTLTSTLIFLTYLIFYQNYDKKSFTIFFW